MLFLIVLSIAATNTGNNALYMVIASMIGLLILSWVMARWNARLVHIEVLPPHETFAKSPVQTSLIVRSTSRWFGPQWILLSTQGHEARVVRALPAPGEPLPRVERRRSERESSSLSRGRYERIDQMVLWPRRGRHPLQQVKVVSLYPLGLFRTLSLIEPARTVLVYPQLFDAGDIDLESSAVLGETSVRRRGAGPELFGLRPFRSGDDPRSIHWKRTAQAGEVVVLEREAEESRRLSLLLDNVLARDADQQARDCFEDLVSEAATLGVEALERGFEVELVTRSRRVGFGTGRQQRRRLLEALALLEIAIDPGGPASPEAVQPSRTPLRSSDPSAWRVRLAVSLESRGERAGAGRAKGMGTTP